MTDPNEIQAAPGLNDRTEQSSKTPRHAAEARDAASTWPQGDADDIVPAVHYRSDRQRLKQAAALILLLVMCLGGTALTFFSAIVHPLRPRAEQSVKGPIDGTYRVDRYRGEGTRRTPDGTVTAAAPNYSTVETEWWAFQSVCPPPSCIAVGTRLDNTTHTQVAARLVRGVGESENAQSLRLVKGRWVSDPPNRVPQDCAAGMPGHATLSVTVEFTQLGDGTLKGRESDLVELSECGSAGTVVTMPIVATRTGDLPSALPPLKTK